MHPTSRTPATPKRKESSKRFRSAGGSQIARGCAIATMFVVASCGAEKSAEVVEQNLTGSTDYDASCRAEVRPFLEKTTRYGRIAANSPAFKQCVRNLVAGTPSLGVGRYMASCNINDTDGREHSSRQIQTLLELTVSSNPLAMACKAADCGPGALACAPVHHRNITQENFNFADWLNHVYNVASPATDPWWPTTQAAALVWHEVMHNYGYGHSEAACTAEPSYHYQVNSVPYIIDQCLETILSQSGQHCGADAATRCGPNGLAIIARPEAGLKTCQCVQDPRTTAKDIALVGGRGWNTIPVAIKTNDGIFKVTNNGVGSFGAWAQEAGATPLEGDFTGDGRSDIALVGVGSWSTIPLAASGAGGDGAFTITNRQVSGFPGWSALPGVKKFVGDFNNDRRADILLINGPGWTSTPIAFGQPDGSFSVTNVVDAGLASALARAEAKIQLADFNADGRTDLVVTGVPGWTTLPVAFANGAGGFTVANNAAGDFPAWAALAAHVLAGDFNGDGKADVALVGGPGWTTAPVALSRGNGTFEIRNDGAGAFSANARTAGAKPFVADFNNDGRSDIALVGVSGWSSIPILFGAAGGWNYVNHFLQDFPFLSGIAGVTSMIGDFDRDGFADIALTGGPGWTTLPVAYSLGDGRFNWANHSVGNFGTWAREQGAKPRAGNFRR